MPAWVIFQSATLGQFCTGASKAATAKFYRGLQ